MEFESTYLVLGNLQVRYYGIIVVVALLAGASVASFLATRSGRDSDHIWGGLTWAIIPGIIGARLWFILFPPISLTAGCGVDGEVCQNTAWFLENFFDRESGAIAIWTGGLGIFGGMIGAALGVYLYLSHWHNRIIGLFTTILTPLLWLLQLLNWLADKILGIFRDRDVPAFRYQRPASAFPDGGMRLIALAGYCRRFHSARPGNRPHRQLRQPRIIRRTNKFALGHPDSARRQSGAI